MNCKCCGQPLATGVAECSLCPSGDPRKAVIEYGSTFSPVRKLRLILTVLATAIAFGATLDNRLLHFREATWMPAFLVALGAVVIMFSLVRLFRPASGPES